MSEATITIYGASDDLIELEGAIREEFNFWSQEDDERRYLAFNDGTVLSCQYDADGIWRFNRVVAGTAKYEKTEGSVEEDTPDRVTLTGDLRSVVFGKELVTAKKGATTP